MQLLLWGVILVDLKFHVSPKGWIDVDLKAAEVKSEKETMRLVPLMAGKWPALFEEVLGPAAGPHGP